MSRARRGVEEPDGGLQYVQGLLHLYRSEPRQALVAFNGARRDVVWGTKALSRMIEIYLNPDAEELFTDAAEAGSEKAQVRAAEQLLNELDGRSDKDASRLIVLRAHVAMATGRSALVESAIPKLLALVKADREYVPAFLAMASAFLLLQQVPKARNQLK